MRGSARAKRLKATTTSFEAKTVRFAARAIKSDAKGARWLERPGPPGGPKRMARKARDATWLLHEVARTSQPCMYLSVEGFVLRPTGAHVFAGMSAIT